TAVGCHARLCARSVGTGQNERALLDGALVLAVGTAIDRVRARTPVCSAVGDVNTVNVLAGVFVRIVPNVDVAAAVAIENGHAEPLPLRTSFVGRVAGFLTAEFVRAHGFARLRPPGPRVIARGRFPRWKLPRRDRSVSTSP